MDMQELVSTSRWPLLACLAREPSSPVAISQEIDTSVAYVSQQLKILEVAGLVQKTKTGATDRGKPRLLYSLVHDFVHITALFRGAPERQQLSPLPHQKTILLIWLFAPRKTHYALERFYWMLEPSLSLVSSLVLTPSKLIVVSSSPRVRRLVESSRKQLSPLHLSCVSSEPSLGAKEGIYLYGGKV